MEYVSCGFIYLNKIIQQMRRKAKAIWKGTGLEGSGHLSMQSGVFKEQPYSFKTRFENEDGKLGTNPEELIAAAHAGCFAMALSFQLSKAGYTPGILDTEAQLTMEKIGEGFSITSVLLKLRATVDNISKDAFMELANAAKEGCPVSQVLNCEINLDAELVS